MHDQAFFEVVNNKKVFAVFSEADSTQKRMVIMSHGFKGTSTGPARSFVDFSRILVAKGYSVLRFDQPNSGNSEGEFIYSSFSEWIATIRYFAKTYLDEGYDVSLLGQSMGATATMVSTSGEEMKDRIKCILLWAPDPASRYNVEVDTVYEEEGQKYTGAFWEEAKNSDFYEALEHYQGGIHVVYGDKDTFITPELRGELLEKVTAKGGSCMILAGQGHSSWSYDACQSVYAQQVDILERFS
jgi:esterase/lipase